MTVTEAAKLIGVSRSALSNLLNGKSALTAEMAARLEKAFNYPREALLKLQAQYEEAQAGFEITPANAKTYVPPFLAIKANDLERWATHNIPARSRFPVLLRTLVHSTCNALTRVDFPGNDDAERPGWDGFVEASEGNPWVPVGQSGWELGTTEQIKRKADGDFDQRLQELDEKTLAETTFVFVTPRVWSDKEKWVASKKAKGFKGVRVYDACDLEQWLEQSPAAQVWFANETNIPTQGVRSLDRCWDDWANVSSPPLTSALFESAISEAKRTMLSRLTDSPERPTIITADSAEEALAFLAQLLGERGGPELANYRNQVLVFDKPGVLARLAQGDRTFIPVVFTREVERELGPYAKKMHSIVFYPRNATTSKPDIVLQPASFETFMSALEQMGNNRDDVTRLAKDSGRSLTVLRRQLSVIPAVRLPEWAAEPQTAASLIPFLLVGAWRSDNVNDRSALESLARGRSYDQLEEICQALIQLNDAPLWSIGSHRGVISKCNLLFAIAGFVTRADLERFYLMARVVLGEDDPALDLPEDQRWAAAIHRKTREFSRSFREGVSETLVLLALNEEQFRSRLGIDTQFEAAKVVRYLLPTPLTTRILEANDLDLPTYAEAAPDEFLTILERDLRSEEPAVFGLLRPAMSLPFGHPSRTGLLWALEGLSWNTTTLTRAVLILAQLAQVEINDNWINKPIHSLESIFRAWMPQTEANHEVRVSLLRNLAAKFPSVAWRICLAQFDPGDQTGAFNHKPRFRSDGYGFGEPISAMGTILAFRNEAIEMALCWKHYSAEMLTDLVERLPGLAGDAQLRVWKLVEDWASGEASDVDRARLREKIRVATLSRRALMRRRNRQSGPNLYSAAKAAYDSLEPKEVQNRHAWLFEDIWVEESADERETVEEVDFEKRQEQIRRLRIAALREIRGLEGFDGLLQVARRGKTAQLVGGLVASDVLCETELHQILRLALELSLVKQEESFPYERFIAGALRVVENSGALGATLESVCLDMDEVVFVKLLVLAPFSEQTWKLVDSLAGSSQETYWRQVQPDYTVNFGAKGVDGVERLLRVGRPRAAFYYIHLELKSMDHFLLYRLLLAASRVSEDLPGEYPIEPYSLESALLLLNSSSAISIDQKAALEFAFLDGLVGPGAGGRYGIPNLERYIELNPELFVVVISWVHKRQDQMADPIELQTSPERAQFLFERGYTLLKNFKRIPGHDDMGQLELPRLRRWIEAVRRNCSDLGRGEIVDIAIGHVLAAAPVGEDGVWPCEVVRGVMEEIQSEKIMSGACLGVESSRGAHWRSGDGGNQERELAEKYRNWGKALQTSHPFVASKLLMALAEAYDQEARQQDMNDEVRHRLG